MLVKAFDFRIRFTDGVFAQALAIHLRAGLAAHLVGLRFSLRLLLQFGFALRVFSSLAGSIPIGIGLMGAKGHDGQDAGDCQS